MTDAIISKSSNFKTVLAQLGDAEPRTELEAQAILENIRRLKGHMDNDFLRDVRNMSESSQDYLHEIFDDHQRTAARYTTSISEQLYSSKYRFLYELIQNADDSTYYSARRARLKPSLIFNISPSEFVVETNEDGFRRRDVKAICATGESSKKATELDDQIGEKGFGFKSVFSVAHHVQVQSGLWSFCFRHKRGEHGLGMVTPLPAARSSSSPGMTTKITLSLTDQKQASYDKLVEAVYDLPDTVIFFLQRLERLAIQIHKPDGKMESITIERTTDSTTGIVHLSRQMETSFVFGSPSSETKTTGFYVFESMKSDMPADDRRRGRQQAPIKLAFPFQITTGKPEISPTGQHVFAYLPLQRMHQLQVPSRESVVDCAWNDAIRDGVAHAFAESVATFATKDHPFCYSWLDFLPRMPMEQLWKPLYSSILTFLSHRPILQTWTGKSFKRPSEVILLRGKTLHDGTPLLDDLPCEIYLASEYGGNLTKNLKDLGVGLPSWAQMMDRLEFDLSRSTSKTKTIPPDDKWHVTLAALLNLAFDGVSMEVTKRQISQLPIIPTTTGVGGVFWYAGAGQQEIYFPETDGVLIPPNLGFRLVEAQAASVPERVALWRKLGVRDCSAPNVIKRIKEAHINCRENAPNSLVPASHFRYLFNFLKDPDKLAAWLLVPTEAGCLKRPISHLFFLSDNEYHTQRLLGNQYEMVKNGIVAFIQRQIADLNPPKASCHDLSWLEWLQRAATVRYFPLLRDTFGMPKLTLLMREVLKRSPGSFVGLLQAHWLAQYEHDTILEPALIAILGSCRVPCENGNEIPINETYLPLDELTKTAENLGVEQSFPFLKLPVRVGNTNYRDWRFLEILGVGHKLDLKFYKLGLKALSDTDNDDVSAKKVTQIYTLMASMTKLSDRLDLRAFFKRESAIFCLPKDGPGIWTSPDECVWKAPSFLTVLEPLEPLYGKKEHLETFFKVILNVRDVVIADILDELQAISDSTEISWSAKTSKAIEIYRYLDANARSDEDWNLIKSRFRERNLIVVGEDWTSSSSCLWTSPLSVSGYYIIGPVYPDLETFFVKRLRLKAATATLLVKQLTQLAQQSPAQIQRIREMFIQVGRMVAQGGVDQELAKALGELVKTKFLPLKVSSTESVLKGVEDDFAILDHARFGTAFEGHRIYLDFSLGESQSLDSIFRLLNLTDHYLSNSVKQVSIVDEKATENQKLSQGLRKKSFALYCCAAKFKSVLAFPEDIKLFQQLSRLQLYTTDAITTKLVLRLQNTTITVESSRIHIHREVSEEQLKVYVPENRAEQASCYRAQLPDLLRHILGITTPEANYQISLILSTANDELENLMRDLDISPVPWIAQPAQEPVIASGSEDCLGNVIVHTPASVRTPSEYETYSNTPIAEQRLGQGSASGTYTNPPGWRQDDDFGTPVLPNKYRDLLEHIAIHSSRSNRHREPGAYALSDLRRTLPDGASDERMFDRDGTFGVRNNDPMAHDRKIGAAGELFVFETLSQLELHNFSQENWQSTIRGEVQVHEEFSHIRNWIGHETADIVYTDTDGAFTQYLKDNYYGKFPEIEMEEPQTFTPIEYFIEVKTTTRGADTRFFMSKNQYNRMKDYQVDPCTRPKRIYLIFRVFNLTSPDISMRIYIDPYRLNRDLLEFEVQGWTITPTT